MLRQSLPAKIFVLLLSLLATPVARVQAVPALGFSAAPPGLSHEAQAPPAETPSLHRTVEGDRTGAASDLRAAISRVPELDALMAPPAGVVFIGARIHSPWTDGFRVWARSTVSQIARLGTPESPLLVDQVVAATLAETGPTRKATDDPAAAMQLAGGSGVAPASTRPGELVGGSPSSDLGAARVPDRMELPAAENTDRESLSLELFKGNGTLPEYLEVPDVSVETLLPPEVAEMESHFRVSVEAVRIPTIVELLGGGFIPGLDASAFRVTDGDRPPGRIDHLITESEPTSVGILVEMSEGINDRASVVRATVIDILAALRRDDEAFLIAYGDEARFLSDFTKDRRALASVVPTESEGQGRALYDAIALGLIQMRSASFDKKTLVIIADGDDSTSKTPEADVRLAAQREGVTIHAIVVAPDIPRWNPAETEGSMATLQELVVNTGGLVALRPGVEDRFGGLAGWLGGACVDLTNYINNQYLLVFRLTNPPPRGQWRRLRVHVNMPNTRTRARSGYVR